MGQVPPKYFLPSAPYGASEATNALNPSQPAAQNPQTPLLPPNFSDPGTMQQQPARATSPATSSLGKPQMDPHQYLRGLFG